MTLEQMCAAISAAGQDAIAAGNRRDLFEKAIKEVRLLRANAIKWRTFLKTTPGASGEAKKVRDRAERRLGQFIIAMNDAGFLTDGRAIPGYKAGTLPKNTLTLKQLGITKDESKHFQRLARMSDEEFEVWLDKPRKKPTAAARRSSTAGPQIHSIALSSVSISNRVRALRPDKVDAMAGSMHDRGLLSPIIVRPLEKGKYPLITGHHRYEGARKLGWEKIDCIIRKGLDAVEAELCEIDENLIRADLTPAEQAAHHARRKELYEQKHPGTKHGGDRKSEKSSRQNGDLKRGQQKAPSRQNGETGCRYTKDTAEKTGGSERTIQRHFERGSSIPNVAELAGTSLDQGAELDALTKLKDIAPKRQAELIDRAKSGEKVSAKAELRKARLDEAPNDVAQPSLPPNAVPMPECAAEQSEPAGHDDAVAAQALAPEADAAPPTAPDSPGSAPDRWAHQRAAFYGFIVGLKTIDFGQMIASMPIEDLQEAKEVIVALSAALDATIERAMPAEEEIRRRRDARLVKFT